MPSFRTSRWAAWAPGLPNQDLWPAWLRAPEPEALVGDASPALSELPAMTRRRLDLLGRAALQVAFRVQEAGPTGPVVLASRWGEIARSVSMLRQLAHGEALSPTAFSLSVHNASSAVYSIARSDTANYSAISAGPCSAAAGLIEALGLLADGARQVLLVSVESALPEPYQQFDANALPVRAWAALIEAGEECRLEALPSTAEPASWLPPDLALLQFLSGAVSELHQMGWHWSRHG